MTIVDDLFKMHIKKEIKDDNEFYLSFNGKVIFKKWLDHGYSKVFDRFAWGKYTETSITDLDLEETPPLFIVKAKLQLYTTENGGRDYGIKSGYRPNHVFEYDADGKIDYTFIGDVSFDQKDLILPGESLDVIVRFLAHQPVEKYLHFGQKWWIHEGPRKIGQAEIYDIKLPYQ